MKKILAVILFLQVFFISVSNTKKSVLAEDQLPSWNSAVKEKIVNYTDMVTDPKNPGFIPESERFAVFDNDGTLWAEQPVIEELFIIYYAEKMIEKNPSLKNKSPFNRVNDFYSNGKFIIKDRKIFDQEQSGKLYIKEASKDTDVQAIPLYITGRYNLPSIDDGSPYLKLNLGYAFNNVNNRNFQSTNSKYQSIDNEVNSKSGSYYGIGGGIEYENGLTLDLIYQVSEDNGSSRNGKTEDNRTTFSVKYKLDI